MVRNNPTIATEINEAVIEKLRGEPLALILGDSAPEGAAAQNTPKSKKDFIANMVFATKILPSDILKVATLNPGESKYIASSQIPDFYRGDDSQATPESNKPWYNLQGGAYVIPLFNENANGREGIYNSYAFSRGTPLEGDGKIQKTRNGWWYVTAAVGWSGINPISAQNKVPFRTIKDELDQYVRGKMDSKKTRSTTICGPGQEQKSGTCCLYHRNPYYDAISGVTYSAGDFYKCTCTKCYKCIEIADKLEMDYMFNLFAGSTGTTGGTGGDCVGCDEENFPINCGPCKCTINAKNDWDAILNDSHLSNNSTARKNAILAKNHTANAGGVIMSLKPSFEYKMKNSSTRRVSDSWLNKEKVIPLTGANSKRAAKILLATEGNEKKQHVVGIKIIDPGSGYDTTPTIDKSILNDMVPGLEASDFRITGPLPNFHYELPTIVGSVIPYIKKIIPVKNIANNTSVRKLNSWSIGTLKTSDGVKVFSDANHTTNEIGLNIKLTAVALSTIDSEGVKSLVNNNFVLTGTSNYISINSAVLQDGSSSQIDMEIKARGQTEKDIINSAFRDDNGNVYTFIDIQIPTDPNTRSPINYEKTTIYTVQQTPDIDLTGAFLPNKPVSADARTILFEANLGSWPGRGV